MALLGAVLSLITPCVMSHTACRACGAALVRETEETRGVGKEE